MKKVTITTELVRCMDNIIKGQKRPAWMSAKTWGMMFLHQCKVILEGR